ncbi:hypothetical protein [Parasitella parasitica]|uniref:Uncharacterized protein n=1 Tax=Parasitella parasitica TaxID=35722 RepID=A0A0B7MZT0_9FUNG|nr:hypothetical protein [Parasitella parasitica]CEP18803.1 hypothetical protein [Parasitella parasitica]
MSLEEQLHIMQQQIVALQAQLQGATNMPMQSADDTATLPLHSMGTRPHYDWYPSEGLTELMNLDAPMHTSEPLSDSERKTIIESYPPLAHLDYKAPATIPTAERAMNKSQRYEDNCLKQLQYQLSAVYRPFDILSHESTTSEAGNPNLERYCTMLRDVRKLPLHVGASITNSRNNIALGGAINPSIVIKPGNEATYALSLDEFQQTLIQQTAARKATREAIIYKRQRRHANNGNFQSSGSFGQVHPRSRVVSRTTTTPSATAATTTTREPTIPFVSNRTNYIHNRNIRPSRRSAQQTFSTMDKYHQQFIGYERSAIRLSHSIQLNTSNNINTKIYHPVLSGTSYPRRPSNPGPFAEISDRKGDSPASKANTRRLQLNVRNSQEEWGLRPVFNLKRLNQFLDAPTSRWKRSERYRL